MAYFLNMTDCLRIEQLKGIPILQYWSRKCKKGSAENSMLDFSVALNFFTLSQ